MEFVGFFQVATGRWRFLLQNRGAQSGMAERHCLCTRLGRGVCVRSKFRPGVVGRWLVTTWQPVLYPLQGFKSDGWWIEHMIYK